MAEITFNDVMNDADVKMLLDTADKNFAAIGYKEHGLRHAKLSSAIAGNVLSYLGYPKRDIELAKIAAYLHDIGNAIDRHHQALSGAILSKRILERLGMPYKEILSILSAVGSHEEKDIIPNSQITAAVILGDKTDVHFSRVRSPKSEGLDKHTRVNLSCKNSFLRVDAASKTISLELTVDTNVIDIGEYFEIFLERTMLLKKAAKYFDCMFILYINGNKFL
ncbi:MAG: HD domain-containing protein [Elusimicrobiota bacterium]|nr:HD domain-containing protein [Elusimicrobiota bacterium]